MVKKNSEELDEVLDENTEQDVSSEAVASLEEQAVASKPTVTDLPGVGAATAEKLFLSGFEDVMSIAVATPGELVNASGVSEAVARKIIRAARDVLDMGFQSGIDLLRKRENVIKIKTGSSEFDKMMGGGFETGAITECFGQYGSGKTQVGHALAVNCQIDDPDEIGRAHV